MTVQELMLPNEAAIKQYKGLGDVISLDFIEDHRVRAAKKKYLIFFKGKLYKFKSAEAPECKQLNIKYCQIDLVSI